MKTKNNTLIITGGGSGGHTSPAISVFQTLQKTHPEIQCIYIGSAHGIEKHEAEKHNIPFHKIQCGKLRRYFSFENITDMFKVIIGIVQCLILLLQHRPRAVFATGGFVALPACIAALLMNIPVLIHEQTATLGLANKICCFFCDHIALSFEDSLKYMKPLWKEKSTVTGNPIRKELFDGSVAAFSDIFQINNDLNVIYVTGGALGSTAINKLILQNINDLVKHGYIIHQYGKDHESVKEIQHILKAEFKDRYIPHAYISSDVLKHIYKKVSCCISRSGASTVNEFMTLKIPAVLIPLKHCANNEQYYNACLLKNIGYAVILDESCTNHEFLDAVSLMLKKERNSENIYSDADTVITAMIYDRYFL